MKYWSNEALVLGGLYGVLGAPFTFMGNSFGDGVLSLLLAIFTLCMLMLCFNKTPKFIYKIIEKLPRVSYYLIAIGWIPYAAIFGLVAILMIATFEGGNEQSIEFMGNILNYTMTIGLPVSLVAAFVRQIILKKKA